MGARTACHLKQWSVSQPKVHSMDGNSQPWDASLPTVPHSSESSVPLCSAVLCPSSLNHFKKNRLIRNICQACLKKTLALLEDTTGKDPTLHYGNHYHLFEASVNSSDFSYSVEDELSTLKKHRTQQQSSIQYFFFFQKYLQKRFSFNLNHTLLCISLSWSSEVQNYSERKHA